MPETLKDKMIPDYDVSVNYPAVVEQLQSENESLREKLMKKKKHEERGEQLKRRAFAMGWVLCLAFCAIMDSIEKG